MTNPLTRFLSSWYNSSLFWEQNIMKRVIANSLMSYVFDVMTNFFEVMAYFWHTFWHHNVVFLTLFLNIWRIFDVMTNLLMSWPVFDIITLFWRHDKPFDVITLVFDVMTSLSWVDNINMDITKFIQIYQNDDVVRLLGRYHVCQRHTHNHYLIRPIFKLFGPS